MILLYLDWGFSKVFNQTLSVNTLFIRIFISIFIALVDITPLDESIKGFLTISTLV